MRLSSSLKISLWYVHSSCSPKKNKQMAFCMLISPSSNHLHEQDWLVLWLRFKCFLISSNFCNTKENTPSVKSYNYISFFLFCQVERWCPLLPGRKIAKDENSPKLNRTAVSWYVHSQLIVTKIVYLLSVHYARGLLSGTL